MNAGLDNPMWALTLLLVAARTAGLLLTAPVLSSRALPMPVRLMMSIVIALPVVGRMAAPVAVDSALALAGGVLLEVGIGATIGFAARLVLAGVEIGAAHVGQQIGIDLTGVFDPSGEPTGTVRQLYVLVAVAMFLLIGGHREFLAALLGTFEVAPPSVAEAGTLGRVVVGLFSASLLLGLKVAAPVILALVLTAVALAMLGRTAPTLGFFNVGLPVRAIVGLMVLAASIAAVRPLLSAAVSEAVRRLAQAAGGI